jgi:hypothetical protein
MKSLIAAATAWSSLMPSLAHFFKSRFRSASATLIRHAQSIFFVIGSLQHISSPCWVVWLTVFTSTTMPQS